MEWKGQKLVLTYRGGTLVNESTGYSMKTVNDRTVSRAKQADVEAFGEIFTATNQGIYNFLLSFIRQGTGIRSDTGDIYSRLLRVEISQKQQGTDLMASSDCAEPVSR